MEQARFNMIEQQIRPWDVLDLEVLDLLKKIKREQFVPPAHRALAFMDIEIPLGYGAKMWQPKMEARALQALKLSASDSILEVGTGSGYLTALLSYMSKRVTSVEIVDELSAVAEKNLSACRIDNVTLAVGDAANGWGDSQYDAIVVTGSLPLPPTTLLNNLAVGGKLFVVIGDAPTMRASLITRKDSDEFKRVTLFETSVEPLRNVEQPQRFVF